MGSDLDSLFFAVVLDDVVELFGRQGIGGVGFSFHGQKQGSVWYVSVSCFLKVSEQGRLDYGMKHHAEFLFPLFSEANVGNALVIVEVFDLELVDCTTAASFMQEESNDGFVSQSFRCRDVWTVKKGFAFVITKGRGVPLVRSFSVPFYASHGVGVNGIRIAEELVER